MDRLEAEDFIQKALANEATQNMPIFASQSEQEIYARVFNYKHKRARVMVLSHSYKPNITGIHISYEIF